MVRRLTLSALLLTAMWILSTVGMVAHDSMKKYIRHDCTMSVGPTNIDVQIDLTFYGERSVEERFWMDSDSDGRVTGTEERAYLAQIAASVKGKVHLKVDDQPLDTILLFDPELDLFENDLRAPYPHLLRLFFFARTPVWLTKGSALTLEDELWSEAPGIHSFNALGSSGIHLALDPMESPISSAESLDPYISSARCLHVGPVREADSPHDLEELNAPRMEQTSSPWGKWLFALWVALTPVIASVVIRFRVKSALAPFWL